MRAVVITEPGGPEVLAVEDREPRPPGEGEVAIRVRAAGVNPTDVGARAMGLGDVPRPWVPGMDAAGTIEAVGPGVDRFAEGDEVFAQRRSLFFKHMQIVRGCDAKRNVLVYMVYTDKLIDGSPKNSTSTVPVMPWGGATETPRCGDYLKG